MAIWDINLLFSNNQALTVTAASANVIDLQGGLAINKGVGQPSGANFVFGEDIGIGDGVAIPKVTAFVTTAFAGGTSLQVQAQHAPDTGAGEPAGTPGTWVTDIEQPATAIPVAALTLGAVVAKFDWPPVQIPTLPLPRYLRLNYVVGGTMTGGTIFAGINLQRQENIGGMYPNNFAVGP